MMQEIANRAQSVVETLVNKYVTRLAMAVPFVIALGFGTAAASVRLTEMYGSLSANTILAGAFAGFGLLATAAIAIRQAGAETTNPGAQPHEKEAASYAGPEAGNEALLPNPDVVLAAIGAIGPTALPMLIRLILRNLPLLVGVLVLGYLLFSDAAKSERMTPSVSEP